MENDELQDSPNDRQSESTQDQSLSAGDSKGNAPDGQAPSLELPDGEQETGGEIHIGDQESAPEALLR